MTAIPALHPSDLRHRPRKPVRFELLPVAIDRQKPRYADSSRQNTL